MVRNYLFCGAKIIERLHAEVPEFVEVISAAGLASMESDDPAAPSAYVVYHGDVLNALGEATGGHLRQAQYVTQLWAVVICVYLADSRGLGEGTDEEGGLLITKTLNALTGWRPDAKVCLPISRHPQQLPTQYDNGFAYYPLVFQVGMPNAFYKA